MATRKNNTTPAPVAPAAPALALDPAILAMIQATVAEALKAALPVPVAPVAPAKAGKKNTPETKAKAEPEKPAKPLSEYGKTVEAAVKAAGGDPAKAYKNLLATNSLLARCNRDKIMGHIEKAKKHLGI